MTTCYIMIAASVEALYMGVVSGLIRQGLHGREGQGNMAYTYKRLYFEVTIEEATKMTGCGSWREDVDKKHLHFPFHRALTALVDD